MMPFQLSVKGDINALIKDLNSVQKKQVPFSTAKALTATAKEISGGRGEGEMGPELERYFDRPTPFTKKGFAFKGANKKNLTAVIFAKDIQNEYLAYGVYGGSRSPKGRAIILPKGIKLNRYGNIPRNQIKKLLAKPDVFSGVVGGVAGIWERGQYTKGGRWSTRRSAHSTALRLLVRYTSSATYRRRFPLDRVIEKHVSRIFPKEFRKALDIAIKTSR